MGAGDVVRAWAGRGKRSQESGGQWGCRRCGRRTLAVPTPSSPQPAVATLHTRPSAHSHSQSRTPNPDTHPHSPTGA
eukprot:scaffold23390_cov34-Isochrysis_galbana.AAC.1